jgi:putative transposase
LQYITRNNMQTTRHNSIKKLEIFGGEEDLKKFLETNFCDSLKEWIKVLVKSAIKAEMEAFRNEFHEKLVFNGYYGKNMVSRYGKIEDVPVARFREKPEGMELSSMGIFDETREEVMKLVEQMHLLGISDRKLSKLLKEYLHIPLSKDAVSGIYADLAQREEVHINGQTIAEEYVYLYVDGIWEVVQGYGWENNKQVMLCVLGVTKEGKRKVLGFRLADSENEKDWRELFAQLIKRGLSQEAIQLIVSDDTQGVKNAAERIFPEVPIQGCIAHKMRNVITKAKRKNRKAVAADVKEIFASQTKEEAIDKAKTVVKKWYMVESKAMESLKFNLEYCFTYFSFPQEDWHLIRTTNILEREFREVRRRMKGFDHTYQNKESATRYANEIFTYLNHTYPSKQHLHTTS